MATIKSTFKRFNGTDFDTHLFETSADIINETASFKVLTSDERTKISDFLTTFNTANKLVRLDANGEIPIGSIPGGLDYLDTNNPTFTGTLTGPTVAASVIKLGSDTERIEGAQEAIEIYADDSLLVSFGAQSINYQANRIQNIGTPTQNADAATKAYVDAVAAEGVKPIAPVKAATTGNITLSGLQTVDGIALVVDNRVLVKNQSTASQNGIYLVKTTGWVKVAADSILAALVFVEEGTVNNDSKFFAQTATNFILFSRVDTITAGGGLIKVGTELSIPANGVVNAMVNSILESKVTAFAANKGVAANATWGAAATLGIKGHIDQTARLFNVIRGDSATNLSSAVPITLANAALKNRTFVETSNPSTANRVTGDLVFQTL